MRAKGLPGLQMGAVAPVLISDCICVVMFGKFFRVLFQSTFSFIVAFIFTITICVFNRHLLSFVPKFLIKLFGGSSICVF